MDDALLQSLPDDPAALKRLVVELARRRDARIAALEHEHDAQLRQRDARMAALESERDSRIAELEQARVRERQRLERAQREWGQTRQQLELEKLRLAHQLELLRKRYYGPRADRVEPNQLLLEFAVALEAAAT